MWELDDKEVWAPKKWCFRIVELEKTLESHSDCKEIKPVNPKGNQPWIFIGKTDVEAKAPILWPPDLKSQLIRKDWCWERLRAGGEGDDMRWLDGITNSMDMSLSKLKGQGSLACCTPWGHKESDATKWLNNNKKWQLKTSSFPAQKAVGRKGNPSPIYLVKHKVFLGGL